MVNPNRVRQARELVHLTQTQLAEVVGVTQSSIAHIEGARSEPSDTVLSALAAHLGFPVEFFLRGDPPLFPNGSLLYRSHAKMNASDKEQVYRYGELEYEVAVNLITRVRVKSTFKLPQLFDVASDGENAVEHAAQLTRNAFGLSLEQPIHNLTRLVEQSDAMILALPVGFESCDAFSQWVNIDASKTTIRSKKAFIVMAGDVPGDRFRFSLAHELGHLVMHQSISGWSREVEDEAHAFASEFLLPKAAMGQQLTNPVTLTSLSNLKPVWGVSIQALIMRARQLSIITPRQATYLFQQINTEKWRKDEPNPLPVEKPRALRRLTEALYGDPINFQKLAHDLNLHPHFVKRVLDAYATKEEYNIGTIGKPVASDTNNISPIRSKQRSR